MKFSSIVLAAAGFAASVVSQTPPGYTWANTNSTLYLKYPGFPVFKGGAVLPYAEPTYQPYLYSSSILNGTYIVFLIDADSNKSAAVPARLHWIDVGVTFANASNYDVGAMDTPMYPAMSGNSSHIPYVAPTIPGHQYIAFIYQSPPNFAFPPNFPYNDTFRDGFNVTRIGVDFKSPLLQANYFTIKSNATASASGSGGYGPRPTGYAPTASTVPFLGSANTLKETWSPLVAALSAVAVAMTVM